VPVELVLDQTIGHIFVARVAGNIVTPEIVASLEYGVAVLGIKVLVVLGHSSCGAVKAAMKAESVPGKSARCTFSFTGRWKNRAGT
jgi:carbonic anhydrase